MTWKPNGDQRQPSAELMLTVRLELAAAQAVYLLAPFNNWSTTATPMHREAGGAWESAVPTQEVARLAFFVWWIGQRKGQLIWGWHGVVHGAGLRQADQGRGDSGANKAQDAILVVSESSR